MMSKKTIKIVAYATIAVMVITTVTFAMVFI